jgi:tRNA nucleotidyltransferase (CCA-adding enzyme)
VTAAGWQHFAHDADIGVRGFGPTREAAFEQAARALTAAVAELDAVRPETAVALACEAPSDERLLVEWLSALVYEMATRAMLFSRFEVRIDSGRLTATAWGEAVDDARHQPAAEAKGATYTELRVGRRPDGRWSAQCVIDV